MIFGLTWGPFRVLGSISQFFQGFLSKSKVWRMPAFPVRTRGAYSVGSPWSKKQSRRVQKRLNITELGKSYYY